MKANYHTHTSRCGHAEGTDEEYVLAALAQGYDLLGFSDHMPWPYESGFTNPHVRMSVEQLDDYVQSVQALREKYSGQIRILTGFECEYFPQYMDYLAQVKEEKKLDYLILGNHYHLSDETGMYFGSAREARHLNAYVESTVKGIQTGMFAYLAHPDLFMRAYGRFDDNCRAVARDLAQACKENNLPMEYNIHDRFIEYYTKRTSYPHPEFFEIAGSYGVDVIIGVDAHEPLELSDPGQWNRAVGELAPFGEKHIDALSL